MYVIIIIIATKREVKNRNLNEEKTLVASYNIRRLYRNNNARDFSYFFFDVYEQLLTVINNREEM